jgi:mRNA interferase MazF
MKAYMTTIKGGEIWLANIPFTDGAGSKKRPVLVLWLDGEEVVVAAVTTAEPRTRTDVSLEQWKESGLRKQSTVRLSRLDCLKSSLLYHKFGHLSNSDAAMVKQVWQESIQLQF